MKSRTAMPILAVWAVLAPLTGCSDEGAAHEVPLPGAPKARHAPAPGKGSQDPDDINGDGYRDLVMPIPEDGRVAVLYGSPKGLDPSTRSVYSRRELGLADPPDDAAGSGSAAPDTVADLDGDGFPDFVTTVDDKPVKNEGQEDHRPAPYVTWGGPRGPEAGGKASPVRLPKAVSRLGLASVMRGDFDGDGHHDLAGRTGTELSLGDASLAVLYGPFTRSGVPARSDTDLPLSDGDLVVDAIDPSGKPRATSVLLHKADDGEQSGNLLYPAHRGTGLSAVSKQLREGNAHAFGDFDGDGRRDVAVGDDGGRNNEPGFEPGPPEVEGSLAVYPHRGAPVTHRLPEVPEGAATDYGPGGFVAADPDGDGRDGVLVATYEGATLIDGDRRTAVGRNVKKGPANGRRARPVGAADFDDDGKDELILNWASDGVFGLYGEDPTHWWITDGTTSRDKASFAATGLARGAS